MSHRFITSKEWTSERKEQAFAELAEHLPQGARLYFVAKHVARSNMSAVLECFYIADGQPVTCSNAVAAVCGMAWDRIRGGVVVHGCGLDRGHHVASNLSRRLYGSDGSIKHAWL